jgi:uncharacterized OB-fold protein
MFDAEQFAASLSVMAAGRPLPLPDSETAFFWEGCARKELLILRCSECQTYVHPPKPACYSCGGTSLKPTRVSGRGRLHSFTITHKELPGFTSPFAVVLVELEEQQGLRLVSNLVDVEPKDIKIGMPVAVAFGTVDRISLPFFRRRRRL